MSSAWSAELFHGDTREARKVLGKRFLEYAAKTNWEEAASMIDRMEVALLFLQDTEQERENVRHFFTAFRAEWVTRQ